jgi:MSHA biogenesis protein MshL
LGSLLGTGLVGASASNAFSAGLGIALQNRNFLAMLNFLQTQGHVHVLSSPRISTLNSQKAVIKVGSEEPFVTNITGGSTSITSGVAQTTPPTLQYQPFFSGISLDVTPQIDDRDNITLHVHAMVNSVIEKEKISQPTVGAVRVPFAVNTISETDSVVKTKDGQVVVIGGLMTESNHDSRAKVPGVGDVPMLGAFFAKGGQGSVKRELVILLKPTVVKDDSVWTSDIATAQGRIATELGGGSQPAPAPAQ